MKAIDHHFRQRLKRAKTLPFTASVQHVKIVNLILQCDECNMWKLLYSHHKLTTKEQNDLQAVISDVLFTCGAEIQDSNLPG